jgi:hypothetical protein
MRFMNISNKLLSFMALAAMIFTADGCSNSNSAEPPPIETGPAVTGVSVFLLAEYVDPWEGAVVIEQGQAEIFYAKVFGGEFPEQDKTWKEVSWSIIGDVPEGTAIETVELVVGEGVKLTVPDNAVQGSIFYIRAASVIDKGLYGEAKITVDIPAVTGVIILEELTIVAAGDSVTFSPVFTGTGNVGSPPLVWEITERVSFTNSADEEEGYLVAAGTKMEENTLFVDQEEKYGTIRITTAIPGTNYSSDVQVLIIKTGTPPLRPPR